LSEPEERFVRAVASGPLDIGVFMGGTHDITGLLQAWSGGDPTALDHIVPLVYAELHRLAHRYLMRERSADVLQTTALVHEVYLRLVNVREVNWKDRIHFLAICANLIRRILVDFAKARGAVKRGGANCTVFLDEAAAISLEPDSDLVALDEALDALESIDSREARVVELRFFSGMTEDEVAVELGVSSDTVMRDWKHAKVWLRRELTQRPSA